MSILGLAVERNPDVEQNGSRGLGLFAGNPLVRKLILGMIWYIL